MSRSKLYVFHPSPYIVDELDTLLAENAPKLEYENVIVSDLLDKAMDSGITKELRLRVKDAISQIPQDPAAVILCSCSTFGGCAEEMQQYTANPIIRIDRPMAELAVESGSTIGVAAALESTLLPTRELLLSAAKTKGKEISIREILCTSAWARRQANDQEGYVREIASCLEERAPEVDVIVLAQGSMAPAAKLVEHLSIPVLSSPALAVKRVVKMCRDLDDAL